jgi:hypothetical protein
MSDSSHTLEGGTMANLTEAVKQLEQERSRMAGQVERLDKAIVVLRRLAHSSGASVSRKPLRKKQTMSVAGRRRIAAAQRARWAKWKREQVKKAA